LGQNFIFQNTKNDSDVVKVIVKEIQFINNENAPFCFKLITSDDEIIVSCSTEIERDNWFGYIKRNISGNVSLDQFVINDYKQPINIAPDEYPVIFQFEEDIEEIINEKLVVSDDNSDDETHGRTRSYSVPKTVIVPSSLPVDIPPRVLHSMDDDSDDGQDSKPHEIAAKTYQEYYNGFDILDKPSSRKINSLI